MAGRRGQPGLRCSRRPGTTDGGGKRRPSEGGREEGEREGGREGRREGWREGRKEGDPPPFGSAAQRPLKEQKPAFSTAATAYSPHRQVSPLPAGHRWPQGFPSAPSPEEPELAGQGVFMALKVQSPNWGPRARFVNAEEVGVGSCRL